MLDTQYDPDSGFGIDRIRQLLPHRYPFLLVDRVLGVKLGDRAQISTLKNVTMNEPFFTGHFPEHAVLPGVIMIEILAQSAGIITMLTHEELGHETHQFYLAKVDKTRFLKLVQPGDQLIVHALQKRTIRGMGIYSATGYVDDEMVISAELMCAARA